jgi:type II secretory pathway pseudopilin PulG
MRKTMTRQRSAFSLLEMVLALAIAMLLLLALYLTLSTQVLHSQIGRETLVEGEVARGILARVANDIANQLGVTDPRGLPTYETAPATPPPQDGTTPADGTTPPPTDSTMPPAAMKTDTSGAIAFNFGIRGDATSLEISSYRVQKPANADAGEPVSSDLRRVAIWLVSNGTEPIGLARHELKQATSADLEKAFTDLPDQEKLVFAREVVNISFEYYDTTTASWLTEWDGSAPAGEDGSSFVGPPAAIRVTITLRKHNNPIDAALAVDNVQGPTYTHTIALPTSNNFPQLTTMP